jgi:hypothetical protein
VQSTRPGAHVLVVQTHLPHVRVHLRSAHPEIAQDTAAATFETRVCTLRDPHPPSVTSESLEQLCLTTSPVRGTVYRPYGSGSPTQALVVIVTPKKAGMVNLDGIQIAYREGIRFGRESVGLDLSIKATAG